MQSRRNRDAGFVAFGGFGNRFSRSMTPSIVVKVRGGGDDMDSEGYDSDSESGVESSDGEDVASSESDVESSDESDEDGETDEDESAGDMEEDSSSAENVDVLSPSGEVLMSSEVDEGDIEKAESLSQQGRNLGISTALWLSLLTDCILNGSKRAELFPSVLSSSASKLVPTASICSGFALASGVAFLLWRDSDARAGQLRGEEKKDSFLALSSSADDDIEFTSRVRRRLCLHSALFGIINLGAHIGHGAGAPFLGLSAAAINFHNALSAGSAFLKETQGKNVLLSLVEAVQSTAKGLFGGVGVARGSGEGSGSQSVERDETKRRLNSLAFQVAAFASWLKVAQTIASIATGMKVFVGGSPPMDAARRIALQWASLAKFGLAAGVSLTLKDAADQDKLSEPFFVVLSGIVAAICASVGAVLLVGAGAEGTAGFRGEGVNLILLSVLSGYNVASGLIGNLKSK